MGDEKDQCLDSEEEEQCGSGLPCPPMYQVNTYLPLGPSSFQMSPFPQALVGRKPARKPRLTRNSASPISSPLDVGILVPQGFGSDLPTQWFRLEKGLHVYKYDLVKTSFLPWDQDTEQPSLLQISALPSS